MESQIFRAECSRYQQKMEIVDNTNIFSRKILSKNISFSEKIPIILKLSSHIAHKILQPLELSQFMHIVPVIRRDT